MRTFKRLLSARARLPERALGAVRPGVEALLLAAVALGCAQAGWSALAPHIAYGSADASPRDDQQPRQSAAQEILSPFAPAATDADSASHAAAALLASVRVAGVRVAEDAARSGAVLTLEGGAQRAFMIGQEVSAGVRLADVRPDYVLLAYDGGQTQISVAPAPSFSFARALMGQTDADQAVADQARAVIADTPQTAASVGSRAGAAWLAATFAQLESVNGRELGWRVAASLPAQAVAAGLRAGDLIVAVNGLGPTRALEAFGAAATGRVELSIVRAAGERVTVTLASDSPA